MSNGLPKLIHGETGLETYLDKEDLILGSDPSCDVVFPDPEISAHHARIFKENKNWMIDDLGSTQGTLVNGQKLTLPLMLRDGDEVRLAERVKLTYSQE